MAKTRKAMIKEYMAEVGRKGGLARAKNLSKEELSEIGKIGAKAAKASGKKLGRPKKIKS